MLLKTILNKRYPLKSHVYHSTKIEEYGGSESLIIEIVPRSNGRKTCSKCGKEGCSGYDQLSTRHVAFIPLYWYEDFSQIHAPSSSVSTLRTNSRVSSFRKRQEPSVSTPDADGLLF